ncbi:FkbM family methyltransferase [Mesorhizobium sophorae]|uniref:FkbM family methyltransferase n=1 Tax=Mesorhizobium sophorae TaxID=1300294 RepID=UPI000BA3CFBA|nr:FkbM family methyltransferase [Mesorhizobium sophorae]
MSLKQRADWKGVASFSQSVFCAPEPRNTKFIYAVVRNYIFDELSRQETVRFVQVGTNDGMGTDPLRAHVLSHGWRGLLIEPIPQAFNRLKATYGAPSGVDFANVAIWPDEGEKTLHVVKGYDVLSSFSLETIMRHEPKYDDLRSEILAIEVPTRRLDSLLLETGHSEPHVLVVDTEGCDAIVLRTYDFSRHKPSVIQFEYVHLSAEASSDLRDWFTGLGYALLFDRHDVLALVTTRFEVAFVRFCQDLLSTARAN